MCVESDSWGKQEARNNYRFIFKNEGGSNFIRHMASINHRLHAKVRKKSTIAAADAGFIRLQLIQRTITSGSGFTNLAAHRVPATFHASSSALFTKVEMCLARTLSPQITNQCSLFIHAPDQILHWLEINLFFAGVDLNVVCTLGQCTSGRSPRTYTLRHLLPGTQRAFYHESRRKRNRE